MIYYYNYNNLGTEPTTIIMTDKSSLLGTAINKSLGGFADGLGMTGFSITNGLRQLLPEMWTGLKLKQMANYHGGL